LEQIRNNDRKVLEEGEISKKEETTFNLKDGLTSTYLSVKIPLRDETGNIYALCGISTDITIRKQAEEQMLDSLRQLEEKELAKTRFLAAAGHDLRQPVAAANLFVDALKLTSPTPRQSELIARLDQSMSVFSGLLERLLDISKFDAGLVKPQIASFDLAELFNWLEQNFAQSALERRLRFHLCFPNRSLFLRTDIFLLQSVLMNLVSNAIKFTAHGGILIGARQRGNTVLLQVWDTGIGIAAAELPHIFDEFYQIANPQRSREAGLGLGLAICQRAMSLLGGEVTCRSHLGRGSVFEICLPLNGAPREIEQLPGINTPTSIANETLLRNKRVIVVEDDALVAAGMVNLLQGMGAEVRLFYSAEAALRQTDLGNVDYFIVDYSLGGELTGLNFLVAVQQRQQTPIRAVVITGETSSQFISSVASSPWPVLHKPVNFAKLVSALRL
ncbi:MAG: ATP-binding protein, partial [Gallionellaceae bacterium]